ncbi:MAG: aldehyde dehydrogenase family protein, partial [Adhaeribacter sp.]
MDLNPIFENTRQASRALARLAPEKVNAILLDLADAAEAHTDTLLAENAKDLARMDAGDPKFDRLKLTAPRIAAIAADIRSVAGLTSPLGQQISHRVLDNGLELSRVRVPLGVVGIIYEARPNVTFDVFALCLKTGNACILKGGSDADASNQAILALIHQVLRRHQVDPAVVALLPPDRQATAALLEAVGYVDVLIPRGSQSLIDFVRKQARVPVIETGAGIV